MNIDSWIYFLAIGVVAGWVAGLLVKGKGQGLLGNMIVGVIGSFLGGWLFKWLGISVGGIIGTVIMSFIGAVVLLALFQLVNRN